MFEHRSQRLLPRAQFLLRLLRHGSIAVGMIAASLLVGVAGYRMTEGLGWVDAILEASMILAGMGPVHDLHTVAGKLFASAYALFAGVAFVAVAGVTVAPIFHRFLHRFHLEIAEVDVARSRPLS